MTQRARSTKDKKRKQELILNSARDLFYEYGYNGTTIEMITEKANVSTGTFYLYFKNKIEIYKALQLEGMEILVDMINKAISWPGMSSLSKLTEIAKVYYEYYINYRKYFDIMAVLSASPQELKEKKTEISKVIDTKLFNLLKLIESIILEGIEKAEFKKIDTWKATNVFWGLVDGLMLLEERNNVENVIGIRLDELIKQALEMTFFGIVKTQ